MGLGGIKSDFRVGQKVIFGRDNGEHTLGVIEKMNPTKAKVKTLEDRGAAHRAGVIWSVPYSMMKPAPDGAGHPLAIDPKKPIVIERVPVKLEYNPFGGTENKLLEALSAVYNGLSPENLHCDGEASATHVRAKLAELTRQKRGICMALGREVDETEVYYWTESKRKWHRENDRKAV
jgi:hypothetical protein